MTFIQKSFSLNLLHYIFAWFIIVIIDEISEVNKMKKMTKNETFLVRAIINISILISMLFPVSFLMRGTDVADKMVSFEPFASCNVKLITLMSFSPAIAVMVSLAAYGIVLMRVTFRNI